MKTRRIGKWALGIALIIAFVLIALSIDQLQSFDTGVSVAVAGIRAPWLTTAMKWVTQLASPPVLMLLSAALMFALKKSRLQVPLIANLGISVILNLGLKALFTRPRPVEVPPLVIEAGYSFPSGHSMAAAAFYGFVIYVIWRSKVNKRVKVWASALCVSLIGLVGFSRVYLGVHYLSDVVAGFLVSSLYLMVFTSFVTAYFHGNKSLGEQLEATRVPTLLMSFAHAGDGIIGGLKAERNMVIHFGMMTLVIVLASLLHVSLMEWCLLLILFGMVLAAELINTAIEAVVDLATPGKHPLAKLAKDTAAGAVLVTALIAAIVGLIILGPKLIWLIKTGL